MTGQIPEARRINILLPEQTLAVLERVTVRGGRSRFISEAVLHYVREISTRRLRERLKTGYQVRAQEDLEIAAEWFPLEEDSHRGRKTVRREAR